MIRRRNLPGDHDRNVVGSVDARRASLEEKAVRGVEGERANIEAGNDRDVAVEALDEQVARCGKYELVFKKREG